MYGLLGFTARDSYERGAGGMHIKLLGIKTIANPKGPEMDQGTFLVYAAEMPLYPTASLASDIFRWEPVGTHRARAVATYSGGEVPVEFSFNDQGQIVGVSAMRYRDMNGSFDMTQWDAVYGEYKDIGGVRVPTTVEATWRLTERDLTYAAFSIDDVRYDQDARGAM
jgi:hypothetical protein